MLRTINHDSTLMRTIHSYSDKFVQRERQGCLNEEIYTNRILVTISLKNLSYSLIIIIIQAFSKNEYIVKAYLSVVLGE